MFIKPVDTTIFVHTWRSIKLIRQTVGETCYNLGKVLLGLERYYFHVEQFEQCWLVLGFMICQYQMCITRLNLHICFTWTVSFPKPIASMYGIFTYIHLVYFYGKIGKCRWIYHTWILWEIPGVTFRIYFDSFLVSQITPQHAPICHLRRSVSRWKRSWRRTILGSFRNDRWGYLEVNNYEINEVQDVIIHDYIYIVYLHTDSYVCRAPS